MSGATRFVLVVIGAAGLAVVARAATFYFAIDRVAFGLALLLGAGFVAGMGELASRVGRARRIEQELARLPRPATVAAIDATSPALRSVLRARLVGVRAVVPVAGFASYLVGLLVMVGLLGTFLGLVDALRGTRDALGATGDIDALRAALTTPMLGLGRAFGISAAGLTTSALLGLASVFARRVEVSLGQAVSTYGDEQLAPLTVAERTIALSERQLAFAERQQELAERQLALLEAMAKDSAASAAASARASEAVLAATSAVRADVATASARATDGVLAAATAVRTEASAAAAAVRVETTAASAAVRDDVKVAVAALRSEATSVASALRTELATASAAMRTEVATASSSLRSDVAGVAGALRADVTATSSALREDVAAAVAAVREDTSAGVEGVGRAVEQALTPALERAVARAEAVTRERVEAWALVLEADAEARRTRDAELARRWADVAGESAERVAREGGRVLGALRGALGESLASLDGRLLASVDRLAEHLASRSDASAVDLERRLAQVTGAVDALVKGLAGELEGTRQRLDRTLAATSEAIEAHAEKNLARDEERAASLALRPRELAAAETEALARLTRHVDAVDAALAAHLARMIEAQEEASRSSADRAESLEATLREHATRLTEQAAAAVGEASRRAAAAAEVSERIGVRTTQLLEEQATRQAELETRWLAAHEASASRLATLLAEHAGGIDRDLALTRALVDEAAGHLRAGGVEMGAVAEVFTAAVDRYRDASAASLRALSEVDGAVDRAGKKAAVELLTDYLDQTREVFDHSLEVQRELFAELRALRGRGESTPPESTRVRV